MKHKSCKHTVSNRARLCAHMSCFGSMIGIGRVTGAVLLAVVIGCGVVHAAPATNPAGNGPGIAVGTGSSAPRATTIAIGDNAQSLDSNGTSAGGGDVVVGHNAKIDNYANQGGSIAIGENAFAENMAGQQEQYFNFNQTTFTGSGFLGLQPPFIPADPSKVAGSVAVGQNSYARSGGTTVGVHNYKGVIGDTSVDTSNQSNMRAHNISVNATTVGSNSFNNAAFGVVNGSYSAITGGYDGGSYRSNVGQNFGATITGSLNTIESKTAPSNYSGIGNSIVGTANRTFNSNGSLIMGAGNEITNSVTTISAPSSGGNSAKDLQNSLRTAVINSNGGGATMALGGGNKADYTRLSQLVGVNNTLTGTSSSISDYTTLHGFKNTGSQLSHVTVMGSNNTLSNTKNTFVTGDNHTVNTVESSALMGTRITASNTNHAVVLGDNRSVSSANHSIILGSADSTISTSVANAVALGHNANVTTVGGVALGYQSVASVGAGAVGYDPTTKAASTNTSSAWRATDAAVSVGNGTTVTRQITSVAAGTNDTDAVNVAQLKRVVGQSSQTTNAAITSLGHRVDRSGANAAALAALHPVGYDEDNKLDFAAGYGRYSGANAMALGAFYRPNRDVMFSIAGSFGGGENMMNTGISIKVGSKDTRTQDSASGQSILDGHTSGERHTMTQPSLDERVNDVRGTTAQPSGMTSIEREELAALKRIVAEQGKEIQALKVALEKR